VAKLHLSCNELKYENTNFFGFCSKASLKSQPVEQLRARPSPMCNKKKSKHPFFLGIGYASVLAIFIAITLIISGATEGGIKASTRATLGSALAAPAQAAMGSALAAPTRAALGSALAAPEPNPDADTIVYSPYVFDEAKAVPASRILAYYDLNSAEKKLYEEFLAGVADLKPIIRLESSLETEDDFAMFDKIHEVILAVHPEIFWLGHECTVGHYSDGATFARPDYLIDGKILGAEYDGRIYVPPADEEIAAAKAWIEKQQNGISQVLKSLPVHNGMTAFELEVAVHDWLCVNIAYDEYTPNMNTLYGALIEKSAACEGYSASFQYIMRLMGVECLTVYGVFGEEEDETFYHAWNSAKLDGRWYQVDVTFDATMLEEYDLPSRRYLNRTDAYMSYDHLWQGAGIRANANIVCTATDYNYFVKIGQQPIASDEGFARTLTDAISRARAAGEPMFELEYDMSYASFSEIDAKFNLIDAELLDGIHFYLYEQHIVGIFEWYSTDTATIPPAPEMPINPSASGASVAPITPITPEIPVNPFGDVKGTDWFIDAVIYVNDKGLMTGTSTSPMLFSPDAALTRGMVVTVLHRIEGSPGDYDDDNSDAYNYAYDYDYDEYDDYDDDYDYAYDYNYDYAYNYDNDDDYNYTYDAYDYAYDYGSTNQFYDVDASQWYGSAVKWAADNDIVSGYGDGRFGPEDNITREQMATILYNYCKWKGIDVSVGEDTNILSYNDAFIISEWAIPAFQWACGAGIINGKPGDLLDPQGNATRAEFATLLMRFLK